MPRKHRIQFPGAFFHVMSRGTAKADIFLDDSDRNCFLDILSEVVERCSWVCHSYCLMNNHYHILIETPMGNLSQGMHLLNTFYCKRFNEKYGRVGHLLQGRFTSFLIEDDGYFMSVCRYTSLNPVLSGLCAHPENWQWSSYGPTAGLCSAPDFLETSYILRFFDNDTNRAREAYIRFVLEGMSSDTSATPWKKASLQSLFPKGMGKLERNFAIRKAFLEHGYTAKEIASHLNLDLSTIYRIIK